MLLMTDLPASRSRHAVPARSKSAEVPADSGPFQGMEDSDSPDTAAAASNPRRPMPHVPPGRTRRTGSGRAATHGPSSICPPGSGGRSRPPAAGPPGRAGGESGYSGSLRTSFCLAHPADHEPYAQSDQKQRPRELKEASVKDIQLTKKKQ